MLLDLFKNYFSDPTAKWPKSGRQDITFDLSTNSVNGVSLNSQLEDIQRFGKCDSVKWLREFVDLFYSASGLILKFGSGELWAVSVIIGQDSSYTVTHKMLPASFSIIDLLGQTHVLRPGVDLRQLKQLFGEPLATDDYGDELGYSFVVGKTTIQTYHNRDNWRLFDLEFWETDESSGNSTRP